MYPDSTIKEDRIISHAIEFIETPLFEGQRKALITDEEFRSLQSDIIKKPEIGSLIVGTGGLRKVRLGGSNVGKSGGHRVIYLLVLPDIVYLITMYKKGQKESLNQAEKNQMKKLVSILKNEVQP